MRLKEVTISGFRGFNRCQTMNLDNGVVLIYGPNGFGKSSLVEAIEWLFFDEISRKRRSRCKGEYKEDYLRNKHYTEKENPFVEARVVLSGKERTIRKELTGIKSCNLYIDGKEAKDLSSLQLPLEQSNKPILGQSEIQRFVDTAQNDRWTEISRILGIDIFDIFREDLKKLKIMKRRDELYSNAKRVYDSILIDLEKIPSLKHVVSVIEKRPYSHKRLEETILHILAGDEEIEHFDLEKIKGILRQKEIDTLRVPKDSEELAIPETLFCDLSFSEIEKFVESVRRFVFETSKRSFPHIDNEKLEFLTMGLRLRKGEECPFCGEMTLTDSKRIEIEKHVSDNLSIKEKIDRISENLSSFSFERERILSSLRRQLSGADCLSVILEKIEDKEGLENTTKELKRIIEETIPSIQRNLSDFELLGSGVINLCDNCIIREEVMTEERIDGMIDSIKGNARQISIEISKLKQLSHQINEDISRSLSTIPKLDEKELQRLTALGKLVANMNEINLCKVWSAHIESLENLIKDLEAYEKEKAKELLQELSKEIEAYYNELNPGEPIKFTEIVPAEGAQRHARIMGKSYGEGINPVTCFSESHMNCLGLSIYFSQRVDHNPGWGFIILDDPVQSMDINHSGRIINILFEKCKSKQIVVLTHEKQFCDDFHNKFYYEDYLEYELSRYHKDGPTIELKKAPLENCLEIVKRYARGSQKERESGATELRKAVEILCIDILVQKCSHSLSQARKCGSRGPKGFLDKLEKISRIDNQDVAELRRIIDLTNPQAHATIPAEISSGDLVDGAGKIEEIRSKYLNPE
jgi:energy-coupling factor transporter ATP-binding protein EcfA2